MGTIKKLLGKRIRELRKARGITQEELAEKLGIGTPNISYIENGKFAPSIENFEKLVAIFEVEPYELYKFPSKETPDDMKRKLNKALDEDEELLKLVYKFYQAIKK